MMPLAGISLSEAIVESSTEVRLGTVSLEPAGAVVAGSMGQWKLTLAVGCMGIDEGGTIKIAQRFASDWEAPQFDRPADSGFTSVATNGQARLRPRYDKKGHDRPWMQCIVIDVYDGSLSPGDVVTVILGDRSRGSPGIRAQTFQESAHEFRVFVDPTNACVARAVPSPTFPIVAGEPVELVCIAPTQLPEEAARQKPFVKGHDRWGNPTPAPAGVQISHEQANGRIYWTARWGALSCRSNPTKICSREPRYKKYWGDLHAQSDATVGTGTEEEYFRFGRDWARLDFTSHQGNDFQVTDEDWKRLNDVVRQFHRDGEFVVFPGWEWSGNTPAGGDRNVIFLEEDQPIWRSSHWQVPQIPETDQSPALDAGELIARARAHRPDITLLASHVGGRYADIRKYFDQELGPLVELVSCWGVFEWMLWDAFELGYIVGVMCNSDGHKGRPGAEGPGAGQFGIANGLTCVLSESRTRRAIFNALKNRRCYGTTGARIDLDFEINGHPMGSVIDVDGAAKLRASVFGTDAIESLELFRGRDVVQAVRPAAFERIGSSRHIRLRWRGARIRGRGRRVTWDGAIRVEGARIVSASGFFDTPIDRITSRDEHQVTFISQTTGDADGVDLVLDRADRGAIRFESKAGNCQIELAELTDDQPKRIFDFGGLDMAVRIERYPESLTEQIAVLETAVSARAGNPTPYFVKVTQCDGQMAWSSPIYLRACVRS
jgi:hypothetical protein